MHFYVFKVLSILFLDRCLKQIGSLRFFFITNNFQKIFQCFSNNTIFHKFEIKFHKKTLLYHFVEKSLGKLLFLYWMAYWKENGSGKVIDLISRKLLSKLEYLMAFWKGCHAQDIYLFLLILCYLLLSLCLSRKMRYLVKYDI